MFEAFMEPLLIVLRQLGAAPTFRQVRTCVCVSFPSTTPTGLSMRACNPWVRRKTRALNRCALPQRFLAPPETPGGGLAVVWLVAMADVCPGRGRPGR